MTVHRDITTALIGLVAAAAFLAAAAVAVAPAHSEPRRLAETAAHTTAQGALRCADRDVLPPGIAP